MGIGVNPGGLGLQPPEFDMEECGGHEILLYPMMYRNMR